MLFDGMTRCTVSWLSCDGASHAGGSVRDRRRRWPEAYACQCRSADRSGDPSRSKQLRHRRCSVISLPSTHKFNTIWIRSSAREFFVVLVFIAGALLLLLAALFALSRRQTSPLSDLDWHELIARLECLPIDTIAHVADEYFNPVKGQILIA